MKEILKNDTGISLVVVLMIMVLLLSITGAGLMFSGTGLRTAGAYRAGTQALYAADTGVSQAVSQLPSTTAIDSGLLAGGVAYRSGPRNASEPQAFGDPTLRYSTGFSVGSGTQAHSGSQSGGNVSYRYQINVTGTGPIGAAREIEAQIEYGPVPQS